MVVTNHLLTGMILQVGTHAHCTPISDPYDHDLLCKLLDGSIEEITIEQVTRWQRYIRNDTQCANLCAATSTRVEVLLDWSGVIGHVSRHIADEQECSVSQRTKMEEEALAFAVLLANVLNASWCSQRQVQFPRRKEDASHTMTTYGHYPGAAAGYCFCSPRTLGADLTSMFFKWVEKPPT